MKKALYKSGAERPTPDLVAAACKELPAGETMLGTLGKRDVDKSYKVSAELADILGAFAQREHAGTVVIAIAAEHYTYFTDERGREASTFNYGDYGLFAVDGRGVVRYLVRKMPGMSDNAAEFQRMMESVPVVAGP